MQSEMPFASPSSPGLGDESSSFTAYEELPELDATYLHEALVRVWNDWRKAGHKPGSDRMLCQERYRKSLVEEIERAWREVAVCVRAENSFPFHPDYLIERWLRLRKAPQAKQNRMGVEARGVGRLTKIVLDATEAASAREWKKNVATLASAIACPTGDDADAKPQDVARRLAAFAIANDLQADLLTAIDSQEHLLKQ